MNISKVRSFVQSHAKSLILYGSLFAVLAAILAWQLTSLVPGYSSTEVKTFETSQSLSFDNVLDNPLYLLFTLPVKLLSLAIPDTIAVTRIIAVIGGFTTLIIFASLLRAWHGRRTAIFGTILFGTSAWFLHVARFGGPEVVYFGVFALVACGFWLKHSASRLALALAFVLCALLLYVPGFIWFIAIGITWQWKTVDRLLKKHLLTTTLAGLGFLAALIPLGWGLYKNTELIKPWLGLPADWPSLMEIGRNVLEVPFYFLVRGETNPELWLGTAPIFDVFSLAMLLLGGILYARHIRLSRTILIAAIGIVTTILMAIGGTISYTVLLPFAYLVIAAGAAYLLEQWFKVFPRNPIARSIGIVTLCVVVGLACLFQMTHYFVGWPDAQATHETYQISSDTIKK